MAHYVLTNINDRKVVWIGPACERGLSARVEGNSDASAGDLNYRDLMVLEGGGRGPTKLGVVPLSDGAGEVAAIGDGVTRVKLGDRIIGTFHPRWRLGEDADEPRRCAGAARRAGERDGASGGGGGGLPRRAGRNDARWVPLDWARTQNNLGGALVWLGERESGTARLEEAVVAYCAALEESTRDRAPLQWARTQNNLGSALQTLGERESETARLEEAVAAYRAALQEMTRDRVPLQWATTQNNLGNALRALGERENGTARLEEAVAAYRAALEETTRDRVPLDWARTQNNLGSALRALGERESGTMRLEEAVAAYRAALEEGTRDRVLLQWAVSMGDQGVALMLLAERIGDATIAESAVRQIEAAFVTMRDGRNAPAAAYYEAQLPKALALFDLLSRR
jgi:tetratricopeptide (TPR) repeat protein